MIGRMIFIIVNLNDGEFLAQGAIEVANSREHRAVPLEVGGALRLRLEANHRGVRITKLEGQSSLQV